MIFNMRKESRNFDRHSLIINSRTKLILVLLLLPAFPDRTSSFLGQKFGIRPSRLRIQPTKHYFNRFHANNQWQPIYRPIPLTPRPHYCREIVTTNYATTLPPQIITKSRIPKQHGDQQVSAFNPQLTLLGNPSLGIPFNTNYISETPTPVMKKCKGRKNLIDDIGVFSLIMALTSSTLGMYTIIVNSMTSNNVGIISSILSLLIWLPSQLIAILDLNSPQAFLTSNFLNGLSFVNTMYSFLGVVFGTADVLVSVAGETIGVISLILSIIATFPDYLDAIIEMLYANGHRNYEYYIENYGCSVPSIFHSFGGNSLYDKMNHLLILTTKKMKEFSAKLDKSDK